MSYLKIEDDESGNDIEKEEFKLRTPTQIYFFTYILRLP